MEYRAIILLLIHNRNRKIDLKYKLKNGEYSTYVYQKTLHYSNKEYFTVAYYMPYYKNNHIYYDIFSISFDRKDSSKHQHTIINQKAIKF